MDEKPQQLHGFLCDSQSVSTEFKRSFDAKIHPIPVSWTDCSFLNRWSVEYLKINKKAKMKWKTTTTSWVQVWVTRFLIQIKTLDLLYNSSHTFFLVKHLLSKALVGWTSKFKKYFLCVSVRTNLKICHPHGHIANHTRILTGQARTPRSIAEPRKSI